MAEFQDDPNIVDDDALLRRIHPDHYVSVGSTGERRISSAAFRDTELSIVIERLLRSDNREPPDVLKRFPGLGLARFPARSARACSLKIAFDPEPDEPAHGVVYGKKTPSVRTRLNESAALLIPPVII